MYLSKTSTVRSNDCKVAILGMRVVYGNILFNAEF